MPVDLDPKNNEFNQVSTISFEQLVALGHYSDAQPVNKFGHNEAVGTTREDIVDNGGAYPWPTAAAAVTVSSSSANDTSAGSGAQTVTVYGLDANYAEIQETFTLNGQTGVTSAQSFLRVFRLIVNTAGATGYNEGDIYCGTGTITTGVPAVVLGRVLFDTGDNRGENQSLMAIYTVPAGKTLIVANTFVESSSAKLVEYWLFARPLGGVFNAKHRGMIIQSAHDHAFSPPLAFGPKTDIKVCARVGTGTSDVAAGFGGILVA